MRAILLLTLLLLNVGWMAYHFGIPAEGAKTPPPRERWVRTQHGWEKPSDWLPPPPIVRPTVHPGLLAGGQLLISVIALIILPAGRTNALRRVQPTPAPTPPALEFCI